MLGKQFRQVRGLFGFDHWASYFGGSHIRVFRVTVKQMELVE